MQVRDSRTVIKYEVYLKSFMEFSRRFDRDVLRLPAKFVELFAALGGMINRRRHFDDFERSRSTFR
jgi:hypothetical protein